MNSWVKFFLLWAFTDWLLILEMHMPFTWQSWVFVGGELIIVWAFFILLSRIIFATKTVHFVYWLLRATHLRKKAKAEFVKEGDMFVLKVDKLDPGEKVEVEGEFLLGKGTMTRVDGTKKSKRGVGNHE